MAPTEELIATYQGPLIRYARRLVRGEDNAQDIVQETFIRYLKTPARKKRRGEISAWLFRVTHNLCVDLIRRERRRREVPAPADLPSAGMNPAEAAEADQNRRRLSAHLATLSDNQRRVVVLKFQESKSYREIGEITGLSVSNVGYLLHEAVTKLGRLMEKEETPSK